MRSARHIIRARASCKLLQDEAAAIMFLPGALKKQRCILALGESQ
jgi:hypothetical protein